MTESTDFLENKGKVLLVSILFFSFFCFIQLRNPLGGIGLTAYLSALAIVAIVFFKYVSLAFITASRKSPTMVVFLIWCLSSVYWSVSSSVSIGMLLYLYINISFACAIACLLSPEDYGLTIKNFLILVIALDLLVIILLPSIGKMSGLSGWHYEKNQFGTVMAIASLSLFLLPARRKIDLVFFTLSVLLLALSESKTAFALISILCFIFSFELDKLKKQIEISTLITPVIILLTVYFYLSYGLDILHFIEYSLSDEFLTGRAQIWKISAQYTDHPLLGSGYGAFWQIGNLSDSFDTPSTEWMAKIEQGHSGYLDMYATLGLIGVIIFTITLLIHLKHIIETPLLEQRKFFLAFFIFFIFHNFSETSFIYYSAPLWLIFLINFYIVEIRANNEV